MSSCKFLNNSAQGGPGGALDPVNCKGYGGGGGGGLFGDGGIGPSLLLVSHFLVSLAETTIPTLSLSLSRTGTIEGYGGGGGGGYGAPGGQASGSNLGGYGGNSANGYGVPNDSNGQDEGTAGVLLGIGGSGGSLSQPTTSTSYVYTGAGKEGGTKEEFLSFNSIS